MATQAIGGEPEQLEPFTEFISDVVDNIMNDKNNMLKFGDIRPALARILLEFTWEDRRIRDPQEPMIYAATDKVVGMIAVLDQLVRYYVKYVYQLAEKGITLYSATIEPHTSTVRMEFIFNPGSVVEEFFAQLSHSRTLERLKYSTQSLKPQSTRPK